MSAETNTERQHLSDDKIEKIVSEVSACCFELPARRNRNKINELRRSLDGFENAKKTADFTQENIPWIRESLQQVSTEVTRMLSELSLIEMAVNPEIRKNSVRNSLKKLRDSNYDYKVSSEYLFIGIPDVQIKHNGVTYKIGHFDIRLLLNGMDTYNINIRNSSRKIEGYYDHPHISNGNPCLGNYKMVAKRLIKEGNLYDLIIILDEFLHTYNSDNPFKKIQFWGENATEEEEDDYEDEEDEEDEEEDGNYV